MYICFAITRRCVHSLNATNLVIHIECLFNPLASSAAQLEANSICWVSGWWCVAARVSVVRGSACPVAFLARLVVQGLRSGASQAI